MTPSGQPFGYLLVPAWLAFSATARLEPPGEPLPFGVVRGAVLMHDRITFMKTARIIGVVWLLLFFLFLFRLLLFIH